MTPQIPTYRKTLRMTCSKHPPPSWHKWYHHDCRVVVVVTPRTTTRVINSTHVTTPSQGVALPQHRPPHIRFLSVQQFNILCFAGWLFWPWCNNLYRENDWLFARGRSSGKRKFHRHKILIKTAHNFDSDWLHGIYSLFPLRKVNCKTSPPIPVTPRGNIYGPSSRYSRFRWARPGCEFKSQMKLLKFNPISRWKTIADGLARVRLRSYLVRFSVKASDFVPSLKFWMKYGLIFYFFFKMLYLHIVCLVGNIFTPFLKIYSTTLLIY